MSHTSEQRVVVDEEKVFAVGGLNAEIIATGKAEVFFRTNDCNLRIALLKDRGFVLRRGIIYHNYLYRLIL